MSDEETTVRPRVAEWSLGGEVHLLARTVDVVFDVRSPAVAARLPS